MAHPQAAEPYRYRIIRADPKVGPCMFWCRAASWCVAVGLLITFVPAGRAHDRISTKVSWTREIGPLLERRCVACHTGGGFAFPLTTYEDARPWAVAIKEVTLASEMPPWGAAPGVGHFANDRRLTRHELELIAAWVDGGAPRDIPDSQLPAPDPQRGHEGRNRDIETRVPLANAVISEATERTASVTLEVPSGLTLTAWTFEPDAAQIVERVDLDLGPRWVGTWTPGEGAIEFPPDAGVALTASALFTARIFYRQPAERVIDRSGIRIWTTKEPRSRTVRETTVVRSWRTVHAVELIALRPTGAADVEAVARFSTGRVEPLGIFHVPARAPHPLYQLARPLALPAGARVEVTGPVRLLYTDDATRTVKPKVRRRPRR
jgi:mono/diheme cytochrome c family protein